MSGQDQQRDRSPVEVVSELIAAIVDGRTQDIVALVHPQVVWQPSFRPALTMYEGPDGMARLATDMRATYGRFRVEVDDIAADTIAPGAARVTTRVRLLRQSDRGDLVPLPVTSVFTVRGGLVTSVESAPGRQR